MRVFGKLARRHMQEGDGSCRDLKKKLMKSQICQVADLVSPDAKDLGIDMPEELTFWLCHLKIATASVFA